MTQSDAAGPARAARTGTRRRSKIRARQSRAGQAFDRAWREWINPYPAVEQLSADEIEAIHQASLKVLRETGIRVLSDTAQALYRQSGHQTATDGTVRFDSDLLLEQIALAPHRVTLQSRNPQRQVTVGGKHVAISTAGGAANFSDLDNGRQPGTLAVLNNFCRVAQHYDVIHFIGPFVEPQDIEPGLRHLAMTRSVVTLTDKVPFVFFRGRQAVADAYEIIRLGNGLSHEQFRHTPCCYSVANSNSPLQLDALMCQGIIDAARAGQLTIVTPFTLAGAMAPITLGGALVQQNAEALAGISLAQIARPGAPVSYGSFTSNVDMRTGSPAFGTPEYTKAAFASGQLARRYRLPLRSSGVTASNAPDAQATYETQMSMWGALMGGANILLHGAGWLEGGLTASAEKFIIDIEMLQMFAELFKPLEISEATLATDAIADVGPGGHYFATPHTINRFENAFYSPLLSDWNNFESWRDNGAQDATTRASKIYKETAATDPLQTLDADRLAAIDDFINIRKSEGGADLER